ncbi:MAG TPA: sigma 54-interacting transcriptional regulator [Kofleriaceae bacterium]
MKDRGGPDETAGEALPTEQLGTVSSTGGIGRAYSLLIFERDGSWSLPLPPEGTIRIGRAPDVALRLSDRGVSARHAEITAFGGNLVIQDLRSTNGTRVNGRRTDRAILAPGDLVTVGSVTMVVRSGGESAFGREWLTWDDFRTRTAAEIDRAQRYQRLLTLACFDLGERAGGPGGRGELEAALEPLIRAMDVVGVSDRGELLVLMPEVGAEDAFAAIGRIREVIDPAPARIGFATFPSDAGEVDALIEQARAARLGAAATSSGAMRRPFRIFELGGQTAIVADAAMLRIYSMVANLARAPIPVLVHGETGTGKELVARAIHLWSDRRDGPLVALNCAALPESLIDSELFGHEKGAFTGAVGAHPGAFERADGGTLFLDEIGELPLAVQAKLLRVLESKRVIRVGGRAELATDFRVVTASNRDLEAEVGEGRFRQDLFYRLTGATLWLPPLRKRPSELAALAAIFLDAACREAGRPGKILAPEALAALERHDWPGNIRELKNTMEYIATAAAGEVVAAADVAARLEPRAAAGESDDVAGDTASEAPAFRPLYEELAEIERSRMEAALERTGGNQTRAAALLSVPLRTFQDKMKEYGLGRPRKGKG